MQLQANAAAFYSVRSFVLVCILLIFHFLFVVFRVAIDYNLVYQLEYLQAALSVSYIDVTIVESYIVS